MSKYGEVTARVKRYSYYEENIIAQWSAKYFDCPAVAVAYGIKGELPHRTIRGLAFKVRQLRNRGKNGPDPIRISPERMEKWRNQCRRMHGLL